MWEWCENDYTKDYSSQSTVESQTGRMFQSFRGGSWNGNTRFIRCAKRGGSDADGRSYGKGFRVAMGLSG